MEKKINEIYGLEQYEGYTITDKGEIISYKGEEPKNLKLQENNKGYLFIRLRYHSPKIHRLVAKSFIPNPENKEQVNHKNGIKSDNRVDNLEWVTNQQNREHAINAGLKNEIEYNIAQYDLEDNLLNVFYTAQDALDFLNISNKRSGNIGRCIKGERKTAYGYIWKQY